MRWDAVDEETARVLRRLGGTDLGRHYVLVGGTALALLFGHRRSRDLDFFTAQPAERLNAARILNGLSREGLSVQVVSRQPDQLHLLVEQVSVTYLAYPFKFLWPPWQGDGVRIAEPRDIALMKAHALGRRATARDYVDLAYLLEKQVISLGDIVKRAKEVFQIKGKAEFSERLFLQQLVYTEDIEDRQEAVALILDEDWDFGRVQQVLADHVSRFVQRDLQRESGEANT